MVQTDNSFKGVFNDLYCIAAGADYTCTDVYGQTAFDYIKDHDEWLYSGYFEDTIKTQLKGISLIINNMYVLFDSLQFKTCQATGQKYHRQVQITQNIINMTSNEQTSHATHYMID